MKPACFSKVSRTCVNIFHRKIFHRKIFSRNGRHPLHLQLFIVGRSHAVLRHAATRPFCRMESHLACFFKTSLTLSSYSSCFDLACKGPSRCLRSLARSLSNQNDFFSAYPSCFVHVHQCLSRRLYSSARLLSYPSTYFSL